MGKKNTRRNWRVKQVTRRDFTYEEILKALEESNRHIPTAAKKLSKLGRGKVSRQLLRYWVRSEDFDDINSDLYEADQIKSRIRFQDTNRKLRREVRELSRAIRTQEEFEEAILDGVYKATRGLQPVPLYKPKVSGRSTKITLEVLISDLQIGKLTADYNTEVAIKRVKAFGHDIRKEIYEKEFYGYQVEKIILVFLGDLIESDAKHADSARGCDSSTAEQISKAIEVLYKHIIRPVAPYAPEIECIGIGGNHDHDGRGLRSFKAGRTQVNYPIYTTLHLLCQQSLPHVRWWIPEGVFHVHEIYGSKVLYEHGVGVQVNENAMKKRKHERGEQIGQHIFYFRMGDKHNISTFNNAQYVVNGAFFGGGTKGVEYSEVAGYHSQPGQWIGFHVQREEGDRRTTLMDSAVIQLGHII